MKSPETIFVRAGQIRMRVAASGPENGPLVILAHGWPESWYSWRHQIAPLATAGYRVLAPDMRGFGGSDAPANIEDYAMPQLVADMVGLVDAQGRDSAAIVGHDFGAAVAWHAALLEPERFHAVAALSVPHFGVSEVSPLEIWKRRAGDQFHYILYHQEPGVAEAEYEADPEGLLRALYCSPGTPREEPIITDRHRAAGGWIGRLGKPRQWPDWFSQDDLDFYTGEFQRSGFSGGLNWYRNLERNWQYMRSRPQEVRQPAMFMAGSLDLTLAGKDRRTVRDRLDRVVPDLRSFVWLEGMGHWIQQEAAETCSRELLDFLNTLH